MNQEKNLISIIIPTLNRFNLLIRAIESIFTQSYSNYEILLINDGGESIDNILENFNYNTKLKLFNLEKNYGRAYARNFGIKQAKGEYLCYLDDDDIFYPEHLETLVKALEKNQTFKIAYTASYMTELDSSNNIVQKKEFISEKFDYDSLLVIGYIPILSVLHHRDCIEKVGYFDESLESNEDWDFWLRMGKEYNFLSINNITNEFFYNNNKDLKSYYETRYIIYQRYKSKTNILNIEKEREKRLKEYSLDKDFFYNRGCKFLAYNKYEEAFKYFSEHLKKGYKLDKEIYLKLVEKLKNEKST